MPATYRVSTYDPADDPCRDGDWTTIAAGVSLWGLRPILRGLWRDGYSAWSIAIDRED